MSRESDRKCLNHARVHESAQSFDCCETSGQVQHRKSSIHELPVILRMFRVKFDKSDWFWSQSIVFTKPFKNGCRWTRPEVAILGADQKERGLWERECSAEFSNLVPRAHVPFGQHQKARGLWDLLWVQSSFILLV